MHLKLVVFGISFIYTCMRDTNKIFTLHNYYHHKRMQQQICVTNQNYRSVKLKRKAIVENSHVS